MITAWYFQKTPQLSEFSSNIFITSQISTDFQNTLNNSSRETSYSQNPTPAYHPNKLTIANFLTSSVTFKVYKVFNKDWHDWLGASLKRYCANTSSLSIAFQVYIVLMNARIDWTDPFLCRHQPSFGSASRVVLHILAESQSAEGWSSMADSQAWPVLATAWVPVGIKWTVLFLCGLLCLESEVWTATASCYGIWLSKSTLKPGKHLLLIWCKQGWSTIARISDCIVLATAWVPVGIEWSVPFCAVSCGCTVVSARRQLPVTFDD